jgi:phospholipid transport system substrate-binding protein
MPRRPRFKPGLRVEAGAAFSACGPGARFAKTNASRTAFDGLPMSPSRRLLLLSLSLVPLARSRMAAGADPGAAPGASVQRFYDDLLAVMRDAKRLGFDGRYSRLAPTVERAFDLPLMTRIAIGPGWAQIPADQQQRLTQAFSRYTISVYANRFDDYGGERFEVDLQGAATANGVVVKSRLVKSNGEKVALNYLLHQDAAGVWKIIDVYLSGTVSELATRRSEFASVLQRAGAEGLLREIEQRTAALRTG